MSELNSENFDTAQQAEERWTTRRVLVWQGWQEHVDPSWRNRVGDSGRFLVDEDDGLWVVADPEACAGEGNHIPRAHPGGDIFYCTRCGEQDVPWDQVLAKWVEKSLKKL